MTGKSVGHRRPVMLNERELNSILHAIYQAPAMERPTPALVQKLLTTYRRAGGNPRDFDVETVSPAQANDLDEHLRAQGAQGYTDPDRIRRIRGEPQCLDRDL